MSSQKPYAIITAIDEKYADYVLTQWLPSLKKYTELKKIEVVIIDLGLTTAQRKVISLEATLSSKPVASWAKLHPTTSRFFQITKWLKTHTYQKILLIDGGDVLFQQDLSSLFGIDTHEKIHATPAPIKSLFYEWFIPQSFSPKLAWQIYHLIGRSTTYSAGVIFSSHSRMVQLLESMVPFLTSGIEYGADQIVFNYICQKNQWFEKLPDAYNFSCITGWERFTIRGGRVCDKSNQPVAVLHNVGRFPYLRVFRFFDYRSKHNRINLKALWFRRCTSPIQYVVGTLLSQATRLLPSF